MPVKLLMAGGLGNQLFQYAACRALSLDLNVPLIVDTRFYLSAETGSSKDVWLTQFPVAASFLHPGRNAHDLPHRLIRRFVEPKRQRYVEPGLGYDAGFRELRDGAIISGNFNSPLYFAHRWAEIESEFKPQDAVVPDSAGGRPLGDYVAVHIRRGDYVGDPRFEMKNAECYYRQVLDMAGALPRLVFSDDYDYCRSQSWLIGANFFQNGRGRPPYLDLLAMSRCAAVVIANSSFSWWAGWLAFQRGADVFAPAQWIDGKDSAKIAILPDGWTVVRA